MSNHPHHRAARWYRAMQPRDPHEAHRVSTPLELLFDLCFVVAIAQLAARLHHAIIDDHVAAAIPAFFMVFFAIWWAWMNFTWFASAYDSDDAPYRLKVLVQMVGVLVLAAGVPRAFDRGDFTLVTAGYTIMRVSIVSQWLRAAASHPEGRVTARRNAIGFSLVQLLWIAALWLPPGAWWLAPLVLVPCELAIPWWSERARATPWHPHHIAERYGLLTLIVLGESVLSTTVAIQTGLDAGERTGDLMAIAGGALVVFFAMWWLYFAIGAKPIPRETRTAFVWGYGHFFVFASAAAVGAGVAVNVDALHAGPTGGELVAALAVAGPVAIYLVSVALLHRQPGRLGRGTLVAFGGTAGLVLAAAWSPWPLPLMGLALALLVIWTERARPASQIHSAEH